MRPGRPKKAPGVTTTVRYPVKYAEFVSQINLSDFLAKALEEAMLDLGSGPAARFVREARRFGISDAQIGLLITEHRKEEAQAVAEEVRSAA